MTSLDFSLLAQGNQKACGFVEGQKKTLPPGKMIGCREQGKNEDVATFERYHLRVQIVLAFFLFRSDAVNFFEVFTRCRPCRFFFFSAPEVTQVLDVKTGVVTAHELEDQGTGKTLAYTFFTSGTFAEMTCFLDIGTILFKPLEPMAFSKRYTFLGICFVMFRLVSMLPLAFLGFANLVISKFVFFPVIFSAL